MSIKTAKSFKKGFKYRIYPTDEQKKLFDQTMGSCRFVWNRLLAQSRTEYLAYCLNKEFNPAKEHIRPNVTGYVHVYALTKLKQDPELQWLHEVSSAALQRSALDLGEAYTAFFKKKTKHPAFKKKSYRESFSLREHYMSVKDGVFRVAKSDTPVKIDWHRPLSSEPSRVTITRESTGKYYVSFMCEFTPDKTTGEGMVGIDLGLTSFMITSDGEKISNERYLKHRLARLKRLQQTRSRRKKGSKNREKARVRVAELHARISNLRNDYLHKLSRKLINENQVICIENLRVANMVRNSKLARSISDVAWSKFKSMLMYKAMWSQRCDIAIVDTFYPSSHICSITGEKLDRKLDLNERKWSCPHCGQVHDRDINAARNILREGLRVVADLERTGTTHLCSLE